MDNRQMATLVLLILAIPLAAAIVVAVLGPDRGPTIRWISLAATVLNLLFTIVLAGGFSAISKDFGGLEGGTFQPEFAASWDLLRFGSNPGAAIQFYVGLDGLNIWLVLLTALLLVSGVLVSWASIQERVNEFYAWLLVLETALLGVFLAFDIVLFYFFFELTLVPLFFVIGIWGGPQRRYAARKFFIYTLAGSLITLLGVLGAVLVCYLDRHINELTFSIPRLVQLVNDRLELLQRNPVDFAGDLAWWRGVQLWIFLALMAGFAIKVPLVPLHTWLPLAHVEAPTAGSVVLAGVLLKIGAYGFLRLCLPLTPDASFRFGVPVIGSLAVIGIVYGALCALAQDDIKKLVAYSSVSHLGFCMLGMFALNAAGLSGSLLQMVNHGLSTGALFLLVGMLYDRYHTRMLSDYGGIGARLHLLACFMVFFCLTSIGLPGLNGFVGEVLVLMGMYDLRPGLVFVGATGIVLGAWYLLTMLMRVFFGPVKEPQVMLEPAHQHPIRDLNLRELAALVPIAVFCVMIGVYPRPVLDAAQRDIRLVAHYVERAQERNQAGGQDAKTAEQRPESSLRHGVFARD
jgi:NADH-quinone oxidoreductase subunit M